MNLRGTSGSGKSTVVRRVMELAHNVVPLFEEKRRQPIAYQVHFSQPPVLYVPGHYATACGGCDTIKTPDKVYELVRAALDMDFNVLFEGIMVQDDVRRCSELNHELRAKQKSGITVIQLDTKIEECLAGIQQRRDEKGTTKALNPTNTVNRYHTVIRNCNRLRDAGVTVLKLSREAAFKKCAELLIP